MSDAKPAGTEAPAPKKKSGGFISLIVGIALFSAFLLPTELLLFVGMVPTMVTAVTDGSKGRYGVIAVSVPNLAGVLPFLIELWRHGGGIGHSLAPAVKILADPTNILIMYGAAGGGSLIYYYVPRFIGIFTGYRAQGEIAARRALQRKLEAEWGADVASKGKK